ITKTTILGTAFALMCSATALGHHSLVGEFDTTVEVEPRGAITKLEWFNPHICVYMDVTRDNGPVEARQCEVGGPNHRIPAGWKKEDLPLGTVIRARANPARDATNTCSTRSITLDDGTPIFTRTGL